jgi:sugar phosphate permease
MCALVPTVADQFGLSGVWLTIAFMGAVQGPLFPTSSVYLSRWMPGKGAPGGDEKAWGTSMLDIGISLGSLLIIPVGNGLAEAYGWRNTYRTLGLATMGFVGLWQLLAAETPRDCWFIGAEELGYLEQHVPPPRSKPAKADKEPSGGAKSGAFGTPAPPARRGAPGAADGDDDGDEGAFARLSGVPPRVAFHPGVWAVMLAHVAFNFGAYYMTNWNPTYYSEVLGLTAAQARIHLSMPHVSNLLVKALNPSLVRLAEKRGFTLLGSRRLFTTVGFLCSAAMLLPVSQARGLSPWVSTALFSAANCFFGLAPSGFKANYLDITERYVGIISGYGNTLGTFASWAGPQLVAAVLQRTGSWDLVLGCVALVNVLAAANYCLHSTVNVVEREASAAKKAA